MGVSSYKGRKSHTGDEIGGIHGGVHSGVHGGVHGGTHSGVHGADTGTCLGGIDVWCDDGTTSSGLVTSLIGSAGTGSTWSTQGVGIGIGIGGSRGVVAIKVLPSVYTDFTAKGEGTNEFICPLASKRGGTEIQSLSVSFGVLGVITG